MGFGAGSSVQDLPHCVPVPSPLLPTGTVASQEWLQNRGSFYSVIYLKKIVLVSVQFGPKSTRKRVKKKKKEFLTNLLFGHPQLLSLCSKM